MNDIRLYLLLELYLRIVKFLEPFKKTKADRRLLSFVAMILISKCARIFKPNFQTKDFDSCCYNYSCN